MTTFQCPSCELKFRFATELEDHLADQHPNLEVKARSVEDSLLGASHVHHSDAPDYPPTYKPSLPNIAVERVDLASS